MKNNYEDAYYVEHASMESDTLERIELFGPFKWLVCAEEKQKICEGEEDTISAKVVKFKLTAGLLDKQKEKELRYN